MFVGLVGSGFVLVMVGVKALVLMVDRARGVLRSWYLAVDLNVWLIDC